MAYSKQCVVCDTSFKSVQPNAKYCDKKCERFFYGKKHGRLMEDNIPTGTVGAISELRVASHLMSIGLSVFRAMSPQCACDLIVMENKGKTYRVEVKTGYRSPASGNIVHPKTTNDNFDFLAVFIRKEDKIFYKSKGGVTWTESI